MQKSKTQRNKKEIALLSSFLIAVAIIGFTSTSFEREAMAYIPASVTVPQREKLTKFAPPQHIDKKVDVVDLISNNPSVEVKIREIARAEGFKWPDYLVKLAMCESRLDPNASNSKNNHPSWSVDRGLFQISNYWHKEVNNKCSFDITCSTKWAIRMINNGRQDEWVCNDIVLARS